MYNLPYFKETDSEAVLQFMQQHPFAILIGSNAAVPVATQVPFLIQKRGAQTFLKGHMMRHTDHHTAFEKNNQVLCVFTGPHTYVSASLYTKKQVGSTWNYMTVHARGTIRFLPEESLIHILQQTTAHFENNPHSPASFENLPHDYIQRLVKAIAGFEIEITTLDAVFKLSQNQDQESYRNIIDSLQQGNAGAQEIAGEMQRRHSVVFKD